MASTTTLTAAVAVLLLLNLIASSSGAKVVPPPPKHHGGHHKHGGHHLKCGQMNTGACVDFVGELIHRPHAGSSSVHCQQCCHTIAELIEFEAAKCLCATFKSRFLHLQIDVGVFLTAVFNHCGKQVPNNVQCAY